MKKEKTTLPKQMIDRIAEEVAEIVTNSKRLNSLFDSIKENEAVSRKSMNDIIRLKKRAESLENRIVEHIKQFKTVAVEAGRLVTEKSEELRAADEQMNQRITDLAGQIDDLRTAMIKLSNKVKEITS